MTKEELFRLAAAMNGLCIMGCLPGSPADLAGLRYGDVVLEVNGVATTDWAAYMRAINNDSRVMAVRYFRNGQEHSVELDLPQAREPMNTEALISSVAARVLSKLQSDDLEDSPQKSEPSSLLN